MTAVLEIAGLHKRFGGIVVADDITASLGAGEIVGLIGPNGAGKTSLFNLVTGAVPVEAGSIRLNGAALDGLTMHERARRGLARTWQHIRLFPSLSVLDNLLIAPRLYAGETLWAALRPGSTTANPCGRRCGPAAPPGSAPCASAPSPSSTRSAWPRRRRACRPSCPTASRS